MATMSMSGAESNEESMASRGGKAAAAKLTPEERTERAKNAAAARWSANAPQATHEGVMKIGDEEIVCYVLENEDRVISTRGMMKAMGRRWRGRKYAGTELPVFLEAKNLKPFISKELSAVLSEMEFKTPRGVMAEGFNARLLPLVCETYLKARDAGALKQAQMDVAIRADILMRALAHVGIIALVDEATGFQKDRARNALAKVLEAFVAKELRPYVRSFPLDYFVELCRLRAISYAENMRLPRYFGRLTNNLVYDRLAPGVRVELQRKNPAINGRRKHKNFQWLTDNFGHPKLQLHLGSVVTLMKINKTYEEFKAIMDKLHPVHVPAPLFDWLDNEGQEKQKD